MEKANINSCSSQTNNMNDINISTFVPFEYAKNIITFPSDYGTNSTFALRSLRSCQILEEIDGDKVIGDSKEGETVGNPIMVSSWTMIKNNNDYVTKDDWLELYEKGGKDRFAQTDGIAIISTVSKIKTFLEKSFPFEKYILFQHKEVDYPPNEQNKITNRDPLDDVFIKKPRYKYQREYRFAFILPHEHDLEKITFYANIEDYIDKIQFGPEMKCHNIKTLMNRALGPIINLIKNPNFDELQKIIRCPLIKYLREDKNYQ